MVRARGTRRPTAGSSWCTDATRTARSRFARCRHSIARGYHALVISYRNDDGEPSSPDRRYALGQAEWRDLDTAMRWALERGASRFVLAGWSMGGAIVMQLMFRSALASRVDAILLDSPALDWRGTLRYQARLLHLVPPLPTILFRLMTTRSGARLIGLAEPIRLDALRIVDRADELDVPILLLHSTADRMTPVEDAREFAAARPDLVEYHEFDRAVTSASGTSTRRRTRRSSPTGSRACRCRASPKGPPGRVHRVTEEALSITSRFPRLSGEQLLAQLVPPRQFEQARLDNYRPDFDYPSQAEAVDAVRTFLGGRVAGSGGLFSRRKAEPDRPGLYLDGGFGVGKTHLLAALWHETKGRKYFGTFIEYTALVGALGFQHAVELLKGTKLLCIDEFELDDPGDTRLMNRVLGELADAGTRIAATSNTPPQALGEGRFAAQDFLREIDALASRFHTVRIDGLDYRRRDAAEHARAVEDVPKELAGIEGRVALDPFDAVLDHLAQVHPANYVALVEGLTAVGLTGVHAFHSQTDALRFVAPRRSALRRTGPHRRLGHAARRGVPRGHAERAGTGRSTSEPSRGSSRSLAANSTEAGGDRSPRLRWFNKPETCYGLRRNTLSANLQKHGGVPPTGLQSNRFLLREVSPPMQLPISFLDDALPSATTTDTASLWLMVAAALVLIMTPGVAFFYGGMVKAKSVISMMMMSFGAIGLVSVLWVLYGYSMSFSSGDDWVIPHVLANPFADFLLGKEAHFSLADGISVDEHGLAFAGFQATFAIITVALISGAIADRAKFGAWMVFSFFWATLVYFPVASWVFNFTVGDGPHGYSDGGWSVYGLGVNDFAGGTAVHINAGAAGLALALVLGRRVGFKKGMNAPHNVPLTLIGASMLWVRLVRLQRRLRGAVDGISALAWVNTLGAPAAALLGWIIVEKLRNGKATSIGAASGAVAGLVAITPACNILLPGWGLLLGLITGAVCAVAIDLKYKLGFDDSLDVVGIHLIGGLIGTLYIGFFGYGIGLVDSGSWVPARCAGDRRLRRPDLLLRARLRDRHHHREDDGLPDQERGRGRGCRHRRPRRGRATRSPSDLTHEWRGPEATRGPFALPASCRWFEASILPLRPEDDRSRARSAGVLGCYVDSRETRASPPRHLQTPLPEGVSRDSSTHDCAIAANRPTHHRDHLVGSARRRPRARHRIRGQRARSPEDDPARRGAARRPRADPGRDAESTASARTTTSSSRSTSTRPPRATRPQTATIALPGNSRGVAISPDGTRAYATIYLSSSTPGLVVVVDIVPSSATYRQILDTITVQVATGRHRVLP